MEKTYRITDPTRYYLNRIVSLYDTQQKLRVGRPFGVVNAIGAKQVEFHHLRFCGDDVNLLSVGEEDMLSIGRIRTGFTRIRIHRGVRHCTFILGSISLCHHSSFMGDSYPGIGCTPVDCASERGVPNKHNASDEKSTRS